MSWQTRHTVDSPTVKESIELRTIDPKNSHFNVNDNIESSSILLKFCAASSLSELVIKGFLRSASSDNTDSCDFSLSFPEAQGHPP